MKYKLEIYGALCECKEFVINGVPAEWDDFGYKYDDAPEDAADYACGDMRFTRKSPEPNVLGKYNITEEEYDIVASDLEDKLSFGCCGWCV